MATVTGEEPDLFNGLEITDMQEINMDNGDEYVLIPSDNENEEDGGGGPSGTETVASQSVFHHHHQVPAELVDLDSLLDKAVNEKSELRIVKSINLAPPMQQHNQDEGAGGGTSANRDHEMFTMSYHFNLDTQELFNVGEEQQPVAPVVQEEEEEEAMELSGGGMEEGFDGGGITIKEEIDIEETVVNFPEEDDEEAGPSGLLHLGAQLELSDVGHEVSDEFAISESEDDEDCVLLSLIEQHQGPIKEERQEEEKSPVENDHAYTSQSLDEPTPGPSSVTVESIMELSQRLVEQAGSDRDKVLASIASIEEQMKQLKEKTLSQCEKPAEKEPEVEVEAESEPTTTEDCRAEANEGDNLSVVLSENCSEPFEGQSMTDLNIATASCSEESVGTARLDTVPEEQEQQKQQDEIETNLSKVMSPNRSEPLEHQGDPPMECDVAEDPPPVDDVSAEEEKDQEEVTEAQEEAPKETEPEGVVQEEEPPVQDEDPNLPEEEPPKKSLEFSSVDDLIEHGEVFIQQCEALVDKAEDADSTDKLKQFLANLTLSVRRISQKLCPTSNTAEVSVQTEKIKLTREKAISLNEKYKRRLLSSLGDVEAVYSDATASSDEGEGGSAGAASSGAEEDDDDEAFERRQDRRKSKRLERKLAEGPEPDAREEDDQEEQDITMPGKKRNARRLDSTDSVKNEAEEDQSEPDLSQFLVPKSPALSSEAPTTAEPGPGGSDDIPVKNEPYSEENSSDTPVAQKRIIRTSSVDYQAREEEEQEASPVPPPPPEGMDVDEEDSTSKSTAPPKEEEELSKDTNEQSDSELLDDVLPQVDDILLDVDDILPAAEGVVQDYLVEEEVRTETAEEQKAEESSTKEVAAPAEKKPKKSTGKKIDSEDEEEESEDEAPKGKALEDMTESELEEYYDNLRDKEIDKLCNLTNLEVSRNANPQKAQDAAVKKKVPVVVKKKDREDIYDILKDTELHGSDDGSDSASEVVETEELYLQQCNQNMKNQLLNQLSSSDTEQDSGSDEDGVVEALRRGEDSDDSAGSILMEKFLKSLNKDHGEDEEGSGNEAEKVIEEDKSVVDDADKTKESEGEEEAPEKDNEDAIERIKEKLKKSERKTSEDGEESAEKTKAKSPKKDGSSKTTAVDPLDKQLFSKKMFRDVDETLRKDRDREVFGRENGSATSRSERIVSEDSDVELLDVSMFQPKRKLKEKTLEDFDFSATTKRATPQMRRKDTKEDDCISLSSESEAEVEETTNEAEEKENKKGRIRTMLTQDQLADETKTAQKDEVIRVAQLKKKNDQLTKFMETFKPGPDESNLVLDYDAKRKQAICVHPHIEKLLKPHQREGVRFMYDNSYGSVNYINKHPGSGCILAHCMGLGKTLQLITLLHTVMRYPQLKTRRVLVICPKSTVMNWSDEIQHWLGSLKSGPRLKVFYFPDNADVNDKLKVLGDWYASNETRCGCMLIGYEAFRILVNYEKRKRTPSNFLAAKAAFVKKRVDEYLLNPGADLVICDEGHQIKNKKSAISGAVSQIKTKRRIVLTGTPIQNNLKEYYCMVNFIKPSFLGSDREFNNLYANPIKNGQHKDSDSRAIKIMKQRSFVLHNKLSKFVQRREAGVLKEFLPEKFEYVLFVPLTPVQEKMYEVFLQMNEYTTATGEAVGESARGKKFKLLADYTSLRKIWTHPKVLEKAWETAVQEKNKRDARFRLTASPDSDDDRPDDYNDISSGALSVTNDWWRKHLGVHDLESLYPSNKLRIMFEILKQCHERGEKCLIFSAFVAVLNVVEHFMAKIHNQQNDPAADVYGYSNFRGPWEPGKDYYRLDGKTQKNIRHKMITSFNDPSNKRTKCFLISAKAGGQGINLIGANRVIILDTSWNPSNDQQNIFRIFRLGQKKKCYVYRLLAMGTMEEKVYSRSVTKQAMSFRVVDEQQIDRHYSFSELAELYNLSKVADQVRETPILPADDVLAYLLRNLPESAFKYHVHDSLLENKPEQDLSEEEKNEAWAAYEREIQNNEKPSYLGNLGMQMQNFMGAAGAFPGASGSGLGPYSAINYPGLPGALADMYRNDFRYSSSMNQLMYPYGNASFPSLMSDPSYSSIMGKQPGYGNYNIPGASPSASGIPDFAMSAALNGQGSSGGPGTSSYNTNVALQSLLELYSKSLSSGMSSSSSNTVTTATATSVSPSTTTAAAGMSPYSALSALKQFNGFGPPLHHPGSTPPAPQSHSSPAPPPASSSQSPSSSGNAALINMLNEQPMPMSSAASSGPFSHLSSPLPAPSITPLPSRSTPAAAATTVTTMATSAPVLSTASPSTTAKSVIATAPPPPAPLPLPPLNIPKPTLSSAAAAAAANDPKPVPLTTTIVASDDDDVDDDGVPRPHIIVRDPSSINATSAKPAQDKDKVVKKNLNMGIVYPEEKKKGSTKDIMLSAKSITTLTKPTIAVKNVDTMKSSKSGGSPVHIAPRPTKPVRASPVQASYNLPRASPGRPQHPPLIRTPLTIGSTAAKPQQTTPNAINTPRQQQVPVITNAKSLQLQNSPSPFSLQAKLSNPPSSASSSTSPSNALPRGSIAAQQLRELQQRMNSSSGGGGGATLSSSSTSTNLAMAKAKKQLLAQRQQQQQQLSAKGPTPVGIFSSTGTTVSISNQQQQQSLPKALASASPVGRLQATAKPATTGMSPLSDSVSITKITSTGQRIAISNPPPSTVTTAGATANNAAMSFLSGRKQDLVITKTIGGGGAGTAVRKVLPGPNMVVKSQDVTVASSLKRPFSTLTQTPLKSATSTQPGNPPLSMATITAAAAAAASAGGLRAGPVSANSITVRKRKAPPPGGGGVGSAGSNPGGEPPTLIDSLKAKNNSITISEVRSIYSPPAAKKPTPSIPMQPQKRLGSGITITPRKPAAPQQQQPQNVLEVVEIE